MIEKFLKKIMPKYNEENLFSIALTVIILDLLYHKFFLSPIIVLLLSPILVAYLLSIFFALTNFEIESLSTKYKNKILGYILFVSFFTEFYFGLISSNYWYKTFKESANFFDKILIIFPLINFYHIMLIFVIIADRVIKLEKLYVSSNANKIILFLCTVVILIVLYWGKNYTEYPFEVIGSMALGFSSIIIGFKNWFEVKKD